jgi:hypothetical protein
MKKKKVEYVPLVFPWYGAALEKSDLTQRMAVIAYALQDQALIDDVCIRLSDITDSYYNTRKNYVRILLHDPKAVDVHDEQGKDQGSGDAFENDAAVLPGVVVKAGAIGAEEQREHSQNRMHARQYDERERDRRQEHGVVIEGQVAKHVVANVNEHGQSRQQANCGIRLLKLHDAPFVLGP